VVSSGVSQGFVDVFPEVTRTCEQIALALQACGSINLQCRLVEGQVMIFEINPRFSGTTSIRALMGYNEPDVLIRKHVLGEDIQPHFAYDSGLVLRTIKETVVRDQTFPSARELDDR
jgi:carbamoyl-phosphate synthase large subunit